MKTIAWLGLGAMGQRMVAHLLEAGHDVVVYNRSQERAQALLERGARLAATPAEAASQAQVVVAMLTDDEASKQVWSAPDTGAFAGVKPGTILVESSTLTTEWIQQWATQAQTLEAYAVAAPVAGTTPQAEAGALIYFAGSTSAQALEDIEPVLLRMGQAVHKLPTPKHAAFVKLAVNSVFAAQICVLGEVLGAAQESGVALQGLVDVLNQVPVTSPALKGVSGLVLKDHRVSMFPIDLVEKDVRYMARASSEALPCLNTVREQYDKARQQGMGQENIHAVTRLHVRPE